MRPAARSRSCSSSSGSSDCGRSPSPAHGSPSLASRAGHGRDRQLVGVERRRARPSGTAPRPARRARAHGPRAEDGLVRRVLVEVDEDAAPRSSFHQAAVISSGRRRSSSRAPRPPPTAPGRSPSVARAERTRGGRGCRSSSGSRRCRARRAAAQLGRRGADAVEVDARLRVEVEAQLVGDVRARRRGTARRGSRGSQVHRPDDVRHVGEHERAEVVPFGVLHDRRLEPLRRRLGDALLEERAAAPRRAESAASASAGRPARAQRVGDREVVAAPGRASSRRARRRRPCPGSSP